MLGFLLAFYVHQYIFVLFTGKSNFVFFTEPSPVSSIHANSLNSTSIILTWTSEDVNAVTYIYKILNKGPGFHKDMFSNTGNITVSNLQPGTLYSFEIAAQINGTNITGETQEISLYTSKYIKLTMQLA